jgi:hypothetical protein
MMAVRRASSAARRVVNPLHMLAAGIRPRGAARLFCEALANTQ